MQSIKGYQEPGYLQEHIGEPELDEYEKSRNANFQNWRYKKDLAIHRKKIIEKLIGREKVFLTIQLKANT